MRRTFDVNEEERRQFWEELDAGPGFGIWQGNFRDMLTDRAANRPIAAVVAEKIRGRVKDPDAAERLSPQAHALGTPPVPPDALHYGIHNQPTRLLEHPPKHQPH